RSVGDGRETHRDQGVDGGRIVLAPDLMENLARADQFEADFVKAVDDYVAARALAAPLETLPRLRDGFDQEVVADVDLTSAEITNVIWATSYRFDFSLVKLPILDGDGYPIQKRCLPGEGPGRSSHGHLAQP